MPPIDRPIRPSTKWRWRRYSLKSLFIITTLLAVWLAIGVNRARREQVALPHIMEAGGEVGYEASWFYPFRQIYIVAFVGRDFGDDDLQSVAPHLEKIAGFTFLQLMQTSVTDEGLAYLRRLKRIERLHLCDNHITDAGIEHVAQLSSLRDLDLTATLVSDDCLAQIKSMPYLHRIVLPGVEPKGMDPEWAQIRRAYLATEAVPGIVTESAIADLRATMRDCTIEHSKFAYSGRKSD